LPGYFKQGKALTPGASSSKPNEDGQEKFSFKIRKNSGAFNHGSPRAAALENSKKQMSDGSIIGSDFDSRSDTV
jgi:hypothetical protein